MIAADSPAIPALAPALNSIRARREHGMVILSPAHRRVTRRVLFINVSGGASSWDAYHAGLMPSNRLWGCVELVGLGYEVAIVEALPDFYFYRHALPHDLRLLGACHAWLRPDDIVYCAHNTLFWLPLLKRLGLMRRRVVSLLYAREPLDLSTAHDGIIALTPAAEEHARLLAPRARVARLGWGMDLDFLPRLPFRPEVFLSCGRTNRDYATLRRAAALTTERLRLIGHGNSATGKWPDNVELLPGGPGWETRLPYRDLLHECYANAAASVIVLKPDPAEATACGFTNLLEAMAMSRPAILTRTNAVPAELDIEQAGCGIFIPPEDPRAIAAAIEELARDPAHAESLGAAGRQLCETHYNIKRFAADLHRFFETL